MRSNCVHPGLVHTPMTASNYNSAEVHKARSGAVPLGWIAKPEDVAEAVVYLASPQADYVNGAQLLVDGGLTQNLIRLLPRSGQIAD